MRLDNRLPGLDISQRDEVIDLLMTCISRGFFGRAT